MKPQLVIAAALSAVLFVCTALALAATATGTWSIELSGAAGNVHLEMRFDDPASHEHGSYGSGVSLSDLGLAPEQLQGGRADFALRREAGTFTFTGTFSGGKGGGTVVFDPSAAFAAQMKPLGYDLSTRQQLQAAMLDLTTQYVASIRDAGYPNLPFERLISFRALRIDPPYIESMRALFPAAQLDPEALLSLRALGVTRDYVSDLRSNGVSIESPHRAVELRALHVDLAYAKSLAAQGYPHLTAEQLVQLRALNIDAAFIERVHQHNIPNPTVEDLVRLKAMGVI